MFGAILKALGTAAVVLIVSEIAKKWTALAAAIAALPLMTMLVVANIAFDGEAKGGGIAKASDFVSKFFYLFWPGLLFPVIIMAGQRMGVPFWWAFGLAVFATFAGTWGWIVMLKSFGVNLD